MRLEISIDLKGKVGLVTAAGGSIGAACAVALARNGCDVVLNDIDEGRLQAIASKAAQYGNRVLPVLGDASKVATVRDIRSAMEEQGFGAPFVIMNVAGESMPKEILDMDEEDWRRTLSLNLDPLFHLAQTFVPGMKRMGGGRIVAISSISAKQGGDQHSVSRAAYSMAKAGVLGFVRGFAREVGPTITVNAICPGLIVNPRTSLLMQDEAKRRMMEERYLLGRVGNGEDIARCLLYFVAADWVTGEVTDVNGGYYID